VENDVELKAEDGPNSDFYRWESYSYFFCILVFWEASISGACSGGLWGWVS